MNQPRTDADYVGSGIWGPPAEGIRLLSAKVVTTRVVHACPGLGAGQHHQIEPGSRALRETAILEGQGKRSAYTCLGCCDRWLDQSGE